MNFLKRITSFFSSNSSHKTEQEKTEPSTGVVKNFNHSRGYGFIHSKAYGRKIFLHISEMQQRVKVGQKVKFEVEETEKGLRAKNVDLATH